MITQLSQLKILLIRTIGRDINQCKTKWEVLFKSLEMIFWSPTQPESKKQLKVKYVIPYCLKWTKLDLLVKQLKLNKWSKLKDGDVWLVIDQEKLKIITLVIWLLVLELDKLKLEHLADLKEQQNITKLWELKKS